MNEFEKAADKVDEPYRTADGNLRENCIEWVTGSSVATVGLTQGRFQSKVRKLAEKYPDDVKIVQDKDVLVAHIPVKAIKLSIVERNFTEEEKQIARERLSKMRQNRMDDADDLEDDDDELHDD